jgi:hypothetical protein
MWLPMNRHLDRSGRRTLLIDDTAAVLRDFKKIFGSGLTRAAALSASETALFGMARTGLTRPVFLIDPALQGQQGVELVRRSWSS